MDFKAPHVFCRHTLTFDHIRPCFRFSFRRHGCRHSPGSVNREDLDEGGDLTIEVMQITTIRELKAILHEKKHCEDPIERHILKS